MGFPEVEPLRFNAPRPRPLELAARMRSGGIVPKDYFAGAVPVVLDNIVEYIRTLGDGWPDPRLEPMGRLPWPSVWAEWKSVTGEDLLGLRMEEGAPVGLVRDYGCSIGVTAEMFCQTGDGLVWRVGTGHWGANIDGSLVRDSDGEVVAVEGKKTFEGFWRLLTVWRLFTALLRVRGSSASDRPVPRHVRRSWSRLPDGPPPWVQYKSLTIPLFLPPGRPPEAPGGRSANQPPPGTPFSLVRAHIADYRSGRGLFGKHRQLYWRSSHFRGHQRLGAIAKTYVAGEPQEPPVLRCRTCGQETDHDPCAECLSDRD